MLHWQVAAFLEDFLGARLKGVIDEGSQASRADLNVRIRLGFQDCATQEVYCCRATADITNAHDQYPFEQSSLPCAESLVKVISAGM